MVGPNQTQLLTQARFKITILIKLFQAISKFIFCSKMFGKMVKIIDSDKPLIYLYWTEKITDPTDPWSSDKFGI